MTNNLHRLFVVLLVSIFMGEFLAAAEVHPVTGETLARDQTFRYSVIDEPSSIDPQLVGDTTGSEIIRDLFEGLMNQNSEGQLTPGVATNFTVNDDNTEYTFFLRNNARWSDGNPVTANDFVYAWRRLADPNTNSPYSWFMDIMNLKGAAGVISGISPLDALGVSAVDLLTLKVSLATPTPYFPLMTTHESTFPVPSWTIEEFGKEWIKPENIVSNGAYALTSHKVGSRLVRTRNPMYWDDAATIIDKSITYVIADENEAFQYFSDSYLDRTNIPNGKYQELRTTHPGEAFSFPRLCSYYYVFNVSETGPAAFRDVRVRQALSYAIDRDQIIDESLGGGQFSAYTFTPSATANFEIPSVPFATISQHERDATARRLLSDAGYNSGNPLAFTLIFNTSKGHEKIATAITKMWKKKLSVNVDLVNLDWQEFLDTRGNQNFDIARAGWCGDYNEASTFLDLVTTESGYNDGKYSNAEVDDLMSSSRTMDRPYANYSRVEHILADEMPLIPIYHYSGVMMLGSAVKNWPINNAQQYWYSRELYKIQN